MNITKPIFAAAIASLFTASGLIVSGSAIVADHYSVNHVDEEQTRTVGRDLAFTDRGPTAGAEEGSAALDTAAYRIPGPTTGAEEGSAALDTAYRMPGPTEGAEEGSAALG